MCGIAGEISLRPDVDVVAADVSVMVRAMVHRGPDDEGLFEDPRRRVAMGMRRLSIIDLQGGHQPIFNEDESVVCVSNGEIYNFRALRTELERRGHRFRTSTDTEVLVHLYEDDGVAALQRLRGMFAFAIWDDRKKRLFLARDRVGKKPLYYTIVKNRLVFASEITALHALPDLHREVDPVALDLYLTHCYVPAPHSIYKSVRKLPPAHYMLVSDGQLDVGSYWSPATSPPLELPREEILREVSARTAEAVRLRMISDVPLGCFLSGGTDSSSVVALMAEASSEPVKTFSIGFSHEPFSELKYARIVANRYKTDHHEFTVKAEAAALLPEITRHFGEPFGDSSALPTWYVSQLARRHVTVVLNGDGGDELFAGYPWYRSGMLLDRLAHFVPHRFAAALAQLGGARPGRLARLGARLAMPPGERFASLRRFQTPGARHSLYSSRLLRDVGDAAEGYLVEAYGRADGEELTRMQCTDILTYLPEELLVKVDRMTMAHSLEARSPLLDHELLDFSLRIPSRMKVSWSRGKLVLCDAMRDRFPPGFLDRPKMGFSVPVAHWLRTDLHDECRRRLTTGILARTGWFNTAALTRVIDEHGAGAQDWSTQLWNLLVLAVWADLFID